MDKARPFDPHPGSIPGNEGTPRISEGTGMYPYYGQPHSHARRVDLTREKYAHRIRVHELADLCPFFEKLEVWMEVLGYPQDDIFAVRVAAYEAVKNAFQHGNRSELSKFIDFRYLVTLDEVMLEVEDEGPGFDPAQVPDPLAQANLEWGTGLGLFLMRTEMTWVRFNQTGNRVTLCKQRSSS
jgi:serine/threonine-protein kinase RsbW